MRKWALLVVTVLIMGALAGCLSGEAEEKKEKTPELVVKHDTIPQLTGWIDDDGNGNTANGQVSVSLNNTNIISVKFTIKVEDSNTEHSETDQGSDPDDITLTITGGNSTETKEGMTPMNANVEIKTTGGSEAQEYLGQSWTIQIDAELGGEKPAYFFGLLVWDDQGVAYTIDAQYSYLAEETA